MHRLIVALTRERERQGLTTRALAEAARLNKHWTAWREVERGNRAAPILAMLDAAGARLGLRLEWVPAPEFGGRKRTELARPKREDLVKCAGCVKGMPVRNGRHFLTLAPSVNFPCARLAPGET